MQDDVDGNGEARSDEILAVTPTVSQPFNFKDPNFALSDVDVNSRAHRNNGIDDAVSADDSAASSLTVNGASEEPGNTSWRSEVRSLARLSAPVIGSSFALMGLSIVNLLFVGHIGSKELGVFVV